MSAFVAAAVVSVAAIGYSAYEGHQARKDQKRANERAARVEAVRGQQERAGALRQNRLQAAQVFALSAAAGVQGSSGVQGALGALQSNQAINLQFANTIGQLSAERMRFQGKAAAHEGRAAIGEAVGSIAGLGG